MRQLLTPLAKLLIIVCSLHFYQHSLAQAQQLKPNIQQWHKRYKIEQLLFSHNGQYLVSFGDDNQAIVTDVQKRKVMSVTKADELLFVHPDSNYFYTKHKLKDTAFAIIKRAFPLGNVIESTVLPTRISSQRLTLVDPFICTINFSTGIIALPYNENYLGKYTIVEFSKEGKPINNITGIDVGRINAMLYQQQKLFTLTSNALWKYENGSLSKVYKQTIADDYFANMALRNDTAILLSNKQIQWVNTTNKQLLQQVTISEFFAKNENDYTARTMYFHHPFVVDEAGAVWLVDTRNRIDRNAGFKSPSYLLARVTSTGIGYPLQNSVKTYADYESVEPLFAYSTSKQAFAFIARNSGKGNLHIYHKYHGEIYATGQQNIAIKQFKFTGTPGKTLLLTGDSKNTSSMIVNLANGKLESIGTIDERLYQYNVAAYKDYNTATASEKLYEPSTGQFKTVPYWQNVDDNYLKFSYNAPLLLDETLQEGRLGLTINGNKKEVKLYGLKGELISKNGYVLEKYQYDSTTGLLFLQWIARMHGERLQHLINTKTGKLVQQWLPSNALFDSGKELFLLSSNTYATGEGIFSVTDNALITAFDTTYSAKHFAITTNKRYICFSTTQYNNGDKIIVWDNELKKSYSIGTQFNVEEIAADPHSNLIYTLGTDGVLKIWNPATASFVADLVINCNSTYKTLSEIEPSYLLMNKDGYYMGENKYYSLLNLQYGATDYPLSQIETAFQRPDKVLASLGYASPSLIAGIEKIANKRFKSKTLNTSTSDIAIQQKELIPLFSVKDSIILPIQMPATTAAFKGLMAYVNGTALWPTPKAIVSSAVQNITIDLVDATNYIRLCLVDKNGVETPGDYLYVNAKPSTDGKLFMIGIGISNYANKDNNLTYAAKDMKDISNYFKIVNDAKNTVFFTAANEQVTLNLLDSIKQFTSAATPKDKVYLYYAGHGLLDTASGNYYLSTYQWNFNSPSTTGYNIDSLNSVLANCVARKKLMIIDACNSGLIEDVVYGENVVLQNDSALRNNSVVARGIINTGKKQKAANVQYAFNYFSQSNGVDVLAASAGNEYALETKHLQNGLFTYSLLSTLKLGNSDIDKDGVLTTNEVQMQVRNMVEKLSRGRQKPSFRQSNIYQEIPLANVENTYFGYFIQAAKSNHVPTLKIYVEQEGLPIDQKDESGFTALLYACREGSLKAVKYLIENGANVNAKSDFGFSTLSLAAHNNHDDIVYYLLCNGAVAKDLLNQYQVEDIATNSRQEIKNTLANFQQLRQQDSIILKLLTPLVKGDTTAAEILYQANKPSNINHWLRAENTSLLFTVIAIKQLGSLQWLINKQVDINYTNTNINSITPLMMAVYFNQQSIVEILLKNGANKTAKDSNGKAAIDYAKDYKRDALIELLQP